MKQQNHWRRPPNWSNVRHDLVDVEPLPMAVAAPCAASTPLELAARAVVRPGVRVDACGLQVRVPERLRNECNRRALVDRVAGVRMAQPVRGDRRIDARSPGRGLDDVEACGAIGPCARGSFWNWLQSEVGVFNG